MGKGDKASVRVGVLLKIHVTLRTAVLVLPPV